MISFNQTTDKDGRVMVECTGAGGGPAIAAIFGSAVKGNAMTLNCNQDQFDDGLLKYKRGALIQDAFPFLNADEREFLQSGLLPDEFEKLVGKGS